MPEELQSPEAQGFAINHIGQLEGNYTWRKKTELLHGGKDAMMEELQKMISEKGGLTKEDLDKFGIYPNDSEHEGYKAEFIEKHSGKKSSK